MPENPVSPIDFYTAQKICSAGYMSPDKDLAEYQLEKIRDLITRLKQDSLYYRETLSGIDPSSIRTMEDLQNLPVTEEKDLAENEYRFQCVRPGEVQRIITVPTTGTHGKSKRIAFTLSDLMLALKFSYIAFTTFCREGDRLLVFMSGNTSGGIGDSIRRSLEPLHTVTCVYGPVDSIPKAFEFLEEYRPDIVVGIPCQMAALAEYGKRLNSSLTVRNVLLSSDDVPDAICNRLRKIWNCEPFRHFGMTETCLMGGCECTSHCGYHMRNADHFFEVLDPDEEGYGDLAITTFSHEAMPLLRYKTGDIAKISTGKCKCGGIYPRIENVKGRKSNSFVSGNRRIFLRDLEEILFSYDPIIDFECSLKDRHLKIELRTLPELSEKGTDTSENEKTGLLSSITRSLNTITENDISFEISFSETLSFNYGYNTKKTL